MNGDRITPEDVAAGRDADAWLTPDEIHAPKPGGPIETISIRYRRDADGIARGINPEWGRQIAASAAQIVREQPEAPDA